ncbi:phosphoribosyltransferase family protein [Flavihumibacter fluvii]|uniref:phosphoribosyltransferase family protein n=1 Tax=Flavihumibacter fluvii TaxID=2838157 RepID=UPI001BDE0AE0|nr:phosphoribosyltransferase family protein [Flavihumibacter fluvii]ULQ53915.1 phosphoribosyltransferase [Flavihumibacter fluvii]
MTTDRKYILDASAAAKKLERMAYEIAEQLVGEKSPIILAGIRDNGVVMAKILARQLKEIAALETEIIEISLDKRHPGEIILNTSQRFDDKIIILVDDVTNSGKTLLYALKPFLHDHPKKIQILTLVERTHKAFPVKADYVGISMATTLQDHIYVEVGDDLVTGAYME